MLESSFWILMIVNDSDRQFTVTEAQVPPLSRGVKNEITSNKNLLIAKCRSCQAASLIMDRSEEVPVQSDNGKE
jgi:hypothetical protein